MDNYSILTQTKNPILYILGVSLCVCVSFTNFFFSFKCMCLTSLNFDLTLFSNKCDYDGDVDNDDDKNDNKDDGDEDINNLLL